MTKRFADIILPLAVKNRFTYSIPDHLMDDIVPGKRVMVQLGNKKIYSGFVSDLHNNPGTLKNIRPILAAGNAGPEINEIQLKLWRWISEYYMCSEGEVMRAAIPAAMLPEGDISAPVPEKYREKTEKYVKLAKPFSGEELNDIADKLSKAPEQLKILMTYLHLTGYKTGRGVNEIRKSSLLAEAGSSSAILGSLERKKILVTIIKATGRLEKYDEPEGPLNKLTENQLYAYKNITGTFRDHEIVLLHGITSSGKTEIYIHLIEEQLKQGRQVLYLLPEIALTTQIIHRLRRHFGSVTGVYHSRFNNQEKVEIWNHIADKDPVSGYKLLVGVRSSLFLPFHNLGLVIIDEEHDASYKQQDPAPRYHARDSAIMLAAFHGAKTILGSASPSVESYYNAKRGKYGLVELNERYGQIKLPSIIIANTQEAYRKKLMVSHFTPELLNAIDEALGKNEQVILFRNRRGFSPYLQCPECGWIPVCDQCAVNLTYHKGIDRLICHYCGHAASIPVRCESCGAMGLVTRGYGTEKIEDEIKIVFPSAKVGRMDYDTTRNKNAFEKMIRSFEEHRTDILIGTQMISKGLDFKNLTVVGILNADDMLNFPDFRAHERSFQMIEQVSGRAGRRQKQGKVIIQTYNPENNIIRQVLGHDYPGMFRMQLEERRAFRYPPFSRLLRINLKHRNRTILNQFSNLLADRLRAFFENNVLGPEYPVISRISSWYINTILIKIEKDKPLGKAKERTGEALSSLEKETGAGALRISVDVDPI